MKLISVTNHLPIWGEEELRFLVREEYCLVSESTHIFILLHKAHIRKRINI